MHSKFRRIASTVALAVAATAAGCGTDDRLLRSTSAEDAENVGDVGLKLLAAPGVTLGSFAYTITGPGAFLKQGSVNTTNSTKLSVIIPGIPAGTGFSITVSGSTADGKFQCGGSAGFSVTAGATSNVAVNVTCNEAARTGSVYVNGSLNLCPVIDGIGADPAEALLGSTIALSSTAHDSDAAPATITYAWTATLGTLNSTSVANPTFTCTGAGTATIKLTVSDSNCGDSISTTVTCTPVAGSGAGGMSGTAGAGGGGLGGAGGISGAGGGGGLSAGASGSAGSSGTSSPVVINEIESSGGSPDDWVELYNGGSSAVDISGWMFKDNDDTHAFYVLPAGTSIAPGGHYVMDTGATGFSFGLGSPDSARLYNASSVLVDTYAWTPHATTTYGRCPDGTGAFTTTVASTKGAANGCSGSSGGSGGAPGSGGMGGAGGVAGSGGAAAGAGGTAAGAGGSPSSFAWPGSAAVTTVDDTNAFTSNLSGLNYQPAAGAASAVLWAALNSPSKIYRLLWNGVTYSSDTTDGWITGKLLHYTDGLGAPDSEGLTRAEWTDSSMYVSTERNNDASSVSRLSILRFDTSVATAELTALNDWNVTADLPVVGSNLGLEGITYVPDAALVAGSFFDEATGALYAPANYPDHGTGLFFVGVEGNGNVYAYALNHLTNTFTRVATISSGQTGIMDVSYDRETGFLWGYCDNTCGNKATVLRIDSNAASSTFGRFKIARVFERPASLPDSNNEGIAFAPEAECASGQKSFFWSDDSNFGSHALRVGSIPCGTFF